MQLTVSYACRAWHDLHATVRDVAEAERLGSLLVKAGCPVDGTGATLPTLDGSSWQLTQRRDVA